MATRYLDAHTVLDTIVRPLRKLDPATRHELEWRANDLLGWIADGSLDVRIGAEFPLAKVGDAQRALAGRETTGKVLLIP